MLEWSCNFFTRIEAEVLREVERLINLITT